MSAILVDVAQYAGGPHSIPLKQTYVNPNAGYDNVIVSFFLDNEGALLSSSRVLYPHTKGIPVSHEQVNLLIPTGAAQMGFGLIPDAGLWRNSNWDVERGDTLSLQAHTDETGTYVTAHATRIHYRTKEGQENIKAKRVGDQIFAASNGSVLHMSDPAYNRNGDSWFTTDANGILLEDQEVGSGWDYGIDFTTPASACARSNHPACSHG